MSRRLYRSRRDTFLSGVCGGIADYFNFDVSLVRIGWVVATLATGGLGLIAYIIAAVVVPLEPMGEEDHMHTQSFTGTTQEPGTTQDYTQTREPSGPNDVRVESGSTRKYAGLFLIFLGGFLMIRRYIPEIDFGMLGAVALVIVGFAMMTKRR